MKLQLVRRRLVAGAAALAVAGTLSTGAFAQAPKSPLTINVVDVGGALALLQDAIEKYKTAEPDARRAASPSPRRRRRSCPAS